MFDSLTLEALGAAAAVSVIVASGVVTLPWTERELGDSVGAYRTIWALFGGWFERSAGAVDTVG